MPEPRISQDLFNKVADIIDFTPEKYNQGVWGNAATKYIGIDDAYIEWDDVTFENDNLHLDVSKLKESTRVDDACGTAACVAGWSCLLSGFHPTLVELEIDDEAYDYSKNNLLKRMTGKLSSIFSRKVGFNYNVMCDKPDIELPYHPEHGSLLQMDDLDEDGMMIDGNMFYRPDYLGRVLLDLDPDESCILFDGDYTWEADDLRLIGKGESIDYVFSDKSEGECCGECDELVGDCECG